MTNQMYYRFVTEETDKIYNIIGKRVFSYNTYQEAKGADKSLMFQLDGIQTEHILNIERCYEYLIEKIESGSTPLFRTI